MLCGVSNIILELTGDQLSAVRDVPIATVATIWEGPSKGELWMLIIHEALYFGETLKESLLCLNQLRGEWCKG
jgi:hypothetical protein